MKVNFWSVCFCPCETPFSNQLYCLRVLFLPSWSQWKLMLPGFCLLPNWATLFLCQPWRVSNSSGNCFREIKHIKIHFFFFFFLNKGWACITLGSAYCLNKQEGGRDSRAELGPAAQKLQWYGFNLSLGHSSKKRDCSGSCLHHISTAGY